MKINQISERLNEIYIKINNALLNYEEYDNDGEVDEALKNALSEIETAKEELKRLESDKIETSKKV